MSVFYTAGAVAVIYLFVRFIEMRFIVKENKPLKVLFRDGLIVYLSTVAGYYVLEQIQPLANSTLDTGKVAAFTNQPDF